jgi:hypothetical protein
MPNHFLTRLVKKALPSREKLINEFRDAHYVRHNQRRQEHLASLGLPLYKRSVLELGAGIGDHTTFFIDRECSICTSDGKPELVDILKERYHWMRVEHIDLEEEYPLFSDLYEVVYAYGLLYHLSNPERALKQMAEWCSDLLLLETCVSAKDDLSINNVLEDARLGSQARSGTGSRPSRRWIMDTLKKYFPHVYATKTQPWHPEFPIDWERIPQEGLIRSVFIASRKPIDLSTLTQVLPDKQERH